MLWLYKNFLCINSELADLVGDSMEEIKIKRMGFVKYGVWIIVITTLVLCAVLWYLTIDNVSLLQMIFNFFAHREG